MNLTYIGNQRLVKTVKNHNICTVTKEDFE